MGFFEKYVSGEYLYNGKIVKLRKDIVELPNGKQTVREVCEHDDAVAVLAVDDRNRCVMVRQFRYPFGEEIEELPAGKMDKVGEEAIESARRELAEETGLKAKELIYLGSMYPSPGFMTEVLHLYFARNFEKGEQNLDEDEFLNAYWVDIDELKRKIVSGEVKDGKTVCALMLAQLKGVL